MTKSKKQFDATIILPCEHNEGYEARPYNPKTKECGKVIISGPSFDLLEEQLSGRVYDYKNNIIN